VIQTICAAAIEGIEAIKKPKDGKIETPALQEKDACTE
jgi:hypothetical protein